VDKQSVSALIANRFDINDFKSLVDIIKNTKFVNSQFPLGYIIWAQALSVARFHVWFVLELPINFIKNVFLLELPE